MNLENVNKQLRLWWIL